MSVRDGCPPQDAARTVQVNTLAVTDRAREASRDRTDGRFGRQYHGEAGGDIGADLLTAPAATLSAEHPELAAEWHPARNDGRALDDFAMGSSKTAWWQCAEGHEWEARIDHRVAGTGCPDCFKARQTLGDRQPITITHPEVAAQWHPSRNGDLTPDQVTAGSNKRVWWVCAAGHEWESIVHSRTYQGSGCRECFTTRLHETRQSQGEKVPLSRALPELAAQWHPTRNGKLTPDKAYPNSMKKAWWLCSQGHEWETLISSRATAATGCPECYSARQKLPRTGGSLANTRPDLAAQWHPTSNGALTPATVGQFSNLKVWWLCPELHEWEAQISNRGRGRGCPTCWALSRVKVSLETGRPDISLEWHPTRNRDKTPAMVAQTSQIPVWWACPQGHEWQASPKSRCRNIPCPEC